MVLLDTNVLVYAYWVEYANHEHFKTWLHAMVTSGDTFSVPDMCMNGFLRTVTRSGVFQEPIDRAIALGIADHLRARPNFAHVGPGPRHWDIFTSLCRKANIRGEHFADTYLAALAMESGGELASTDNDFKKFPGLRWRNPLNERTISPA